MYFVKHFDNKYDSKLNSFIISYLYYQMANNYTNRHMFDFSYNIEKVGIF